jgi:hypothetical protein
MSLAVPADYSQNYFLAYIGTIDIAWVDWAYKSVTSCIVDSTAIYVYYGGQI